MIEITIDKNSLPPKNGLIHDFGTLILISAWSYQIPDL